MMMAVILLNVMALQSSGILYVNRVGLPGDTDSIWPGSILQHWEFEIFGNLGNLKYSVVRGI